MCYMDDGKMSLDKVRRHGEEEGEAVPVQFSPALCLFLLVPQPDAV